MKTIKSKFTVLLIILFILTSLALINTITQIDSKELIGPDTSYPEVWDQIKDKTWSMEDTFAGGSWTFFEREGVEYVIVQIFGSGVYLATSNIYRLDIPAPELRFEGEKLRIGDDIVLYNPSDLNIIDYQGNQIDLDIYLALQSRTLEASDLLTSLDPAWR